MRSVPHRVVCLLGLDDGTFPRKAPRDGDDLMLADPHVGDRDSRTEDRQLLLDALLAATDRLIITYTGNDERTNIARPPAVPVGELLDVVGPRRASIEHPLQPFDPRNFTRARWCRQAVELRSRDARGRAGAERARGRRAAAVPARAAAAARARSGRARRTSCGSSSTRCARSCASGSGSASATTRDEIGDALPVELDDARAVGRRPAAARRADRRRGRADGDPRRDRARHAPARAARAARSMRRDLAGRGRDRRAGAALIAGEPAGSVDVKVDLGGPPADRHRPRRARLAADDGHVLEGQPAPPARRRGCGCSRCARPAARTRRRRSAARVGLRTTTRASRSRGSPRAVARGRARRSCAVLLDLYDRGMREPLPLAVPDLGGVRGRRQRARRSGSPTASRRRTATPEHELVFGPALPLRGAAARRRRATTSAGTRSSRRASASTRCGCGAGCWRARR